MWWALYETISTATALWASMWVVCRYLHGLLHHSVWPSEVERAPTSAVSLPSSPHIYSTAASLAPSGLTSLQQAMIIFPTYNHLCHKSKVGVSFSFFFLFGYQIAVFLMLWCFEWQTCTERETKSRCWVWKRQDLKSTFHLCQTTSIAGQRKLNEYHQAVLVVNLPSDLSFSRLKSEFTCLKDVCCTSKCYVHSTHEALCNNLLCFWQKLKYV